jgi:hypothetical protein
MPECIEREALIQDAEDVLTFPMLDRINRQPAADVEPVVRCWECKHYKGDTEKTDCPWNNAFTRNEDDYCSHGARMGGGKDEDNGICK